MTTTTEVEELFDAPAPRWSPRRLVIAGLAFLVIAGMVAIAIASRSGSDALAELRVRNGSVSLLRGTLPISEASEGEDLRSGDIVRTDARGQAQVDFFDGSLVRLDADTEVALNTVEDTEDGRRISLALASGRLWNRVAPQERGDAFSVDIGDATVTAIGTSFLLDCTEGSVCYVLGVDSTSEVRSVSGREIQAEEGDCVLVDTGGRLETCDERKLGLLDDWVKENLAQDAQLTLERVESTPSASPTPAGSSRPFVPSGGGSAPAPPPTPKPTPTEVPERTPTPEPEDPDSTPRPRRTKRPTPTPPPPTAVPSVEPISP